MQNTFKFIEDCDGIKAAIVIGSQARTNPPADKYSDLDIIFITTNPEQYLYSDDWLKNISDFHISFVENTLLGAKERRVMFDDGTDIDFIILDEQQATGIKAHEIDEIFQRGYNVIKDKIGISSDIDSKKKLETIRKYNPIISANDFTNVVNDFWFHCVWTTKKILRGELLTAKSCLDIYMKQIIIKLIENYTYLNNNQCDVWYNGRFIERWADLQIIESLSRSYARYNEADMVNALFSSIELFKFLAKNIACAKSFEYSEDTEIYSEKIVNKLFSDKEV